MYQLEFTFSAATLTGVFAVYVLVLLVTLLFFGSLSDYVGRLPVIITACFFGAAGCAVFLAAHDVAALVLARSLQGIATGLASGAIGAALIELQPASSERAALVTSAFSTLGLALGALLTSALVEYAPEPTELIWVTLLVIFVTGILGTLAIAEPGPGAPVSWLRCDLGSPFRAARAQLSSEPFRVWSPSGYSVVSTSRSGRHWPLRQLVHQIWCGEVW